MWYDVEGLRSGARGANNAADQAAVAQSKLTGMSVAGPSAFGDLDEAGGMAAAVEAARQRHSNAIAVFAGNSRAAAQRAVRAAELGAELAAVTERMAFSAAAVGPNVAAQGASTQAPITPITPRQITPSPITPGPIAPSPITPSPITQGM